VEVLRRRWHRTQQCTELPDGGVRVEFDLSSLREVVNWVLEWGPQIVVVEPVALREQVIDLLRATLVRYEQTAGTFSPAIS
jgi:predicted DNA-binding transcriptional regulator YafY